MTETVFDLARLYVRAGLWVLPLHHPVRRGERMACSCGKADCPSPAKHPVARLVPHGLKSATTEPETVEGWFRDAPWNIAVATGIASGIVVLDIDPRHGGDESLAALERQHGPLPPTWRFLTGGGGEHILFRHPGGRVANSAGKVGPGIDVRGDGGYIVAPPSTHICSRAYAISVDHHPETTRLAVLPDWLKALLAPQAAAVPGTATRKPAAVPPEEWRRRIAATVAEGERNAAIARLAGHLLRNRIDPWATLDLLAAWNLAHCRPPLAEAEIAATVRSIASRECDRRTGRHAA
jgi:putative DNA primase/helicase